MLRISLILIGLICMRNTLFAQYTYIIRADSVKITNCDSSELIIENHTQAIPGFLYNTGNGRTIFKHAVVKVNGGLYLIGADTINLNANAWMQGGNSFGATGVLGTLDNHHVDLYTNGVRRVRLDSIGNLLVGTTTDNGINNVQVNGSIYGNYFTNSPTELGPSGALRLRWGSSDGVYMGLYFQSRPTRRGYFAAAGDTGPLALGDSIGLSFNQTPFLAIGSEYALGEGRLTIQNQYGATVDAINAGRVNSAGTNIFDFEVTKLGNVVVGGGVYGADNGKKLQVFGDVFASDSVGIGTSTPTAQLHTTGSVRFAGLTSDSALTNVLVADANGNLYYRSASSLAANGMLNSSLAGVDPTINSSLAVNGEIRAQKLRLTQSGWPDYVFAGGYRLPSLIDLEQYIKQNSHLPDMPSALEVGKKGIDIGENQAALLKKIEELTLYVIEQEKKLDVQNVQITYREKSWSEQNKKLEERVEQLEKQDKEMEVLKQEIAELKKIISDKPGRKN